MSGPALPQGSVVSRLFHPIHRAFRATSRPAAGAFLFAIAFFPGLTRPVLHAQTNEWTWIDGPQTPHPSVYGSLGTPAPGNLPGNRELAASWTDTQGNFWMFGGVGSDSAHRGGPLNDLWQYRPSTNQWAWMGGSSTTAGATGMYGVLGQPARKKRLD